MYSLHSLPDQTWQKLINIDTYERTIVMHAAEGQGLSTERKRQNAGT